MRQKTKYFNTQFKGTEIKGRMTKGQFNKLMRKLIGGKHEWAEIAKRMWKHPQGNNA